MKLLVSGSRGLIGSSLVSVLVSEGHDIVRLVRSSKTSVPGEIVWDPAASAIDRTALDGFDGVVHLAGENIASRRWSAKQKARIRDSRVNGTRLLCEALASAAVAPQFVICASAIGYYGHRADELLTEDSPPGTSFLCQVCRDWETAADPAREIGVRVVNLRLGVVLSANGGALAKMLLPFQMGVGGVVGDGRQFYSWIAIDDVVGAIQHTIHHAELQGPVNAVAPNPVTNFEFTKMLGRVLRRPTIFPMPAFAARLAFGEMADELLLASTCVTPKRLTESQFGFRFPSLESAFRHVLGRN